MRHVGLLRFAYVPQQRPGRGHRRGHFAEPRLVDRTEPKLLAHASGAGHVFIIIAAHLQKAAQLFLRKIGYRLRFGRALVHDELAGRESAELV